MFYVILKYKLPNVLVLTFASLAKVSHNAYLETRLTMKIYGESSIFHYITHSRNFEFL